MNRLSEETSPYLRQHADNPVHWQPWDAQALAEAKKSNKPILLSIGYSANHLCHVMATESFESTQVAKLMNDNFVSIKVDREQRPDIDRLYQTAHQLLNRKPGGWPLTMFLDPVSQLPLFGGTYFPPQAQRDAPSFREVLKGMAKTFGAPNEKMNEFKTKLGEALAAAPGHQSGEPSDVDATLIDRACGQIDSSFDAARGGFSESPKYPHASGLALMLDAAACTTEAEKIERLTHMLDFTLIAMARGGIYDQLGGGFHRYAVDAYWDIPRFEKMLYDNGLLLSVYARRAETTDAAWMKDVVNATGDWLIREMTLDEGAFAASLDSDVDGNEGRYYVWSSDELYEELGDDYDAFAAHYCIKKRKPNFVNNWHLRLSAPKENDASFDEASHLAQAQARARVLALREKRQHPARDEKVLSAWNALAIRGLVDAARFVGRSDFQVAADKALDYLQQHHWHDGRLTTSSLAGKGSIGGFLDDYAYLLDAVLAALSQRWRGSDFEFACALADAMLEHFEDSERGGFYFTAHDHEPLLLRSKPFNDDALPSCNGVAIQALIELGNLSGDERYSASAARALRVALTDAQRWPSAHGTVLRAMLDYTQPANRVVICCDDETAVDSWRIAAQSHPDQRARCYVVPGDAALAPHIKAAAQSANGGTCAVICRGKECVGIASTPDQLKEMLSS